MKPIKAFITAIAFLASLANADVVVTNNGSSINGTILGINAGKIKVATDFAGEIEISQDQVASFSTDEPIYLTLDSGATYLGSVSGSGVGLSVASSDGTLSTNLASIQESWQPGGESPAAVRHAAEMNKLRRHWAYQAAFDMTGKSGNTSSDGLGASFRARLKGPEDKLVLFARGNFEETDGNKSADDARGGIEYSNNFGDSFNWYVRTEFGFDAIKDIDLMFTTAAGFGYTFSDTETRTLDVRAGLGYLFESYADVPVLDDEGNVIGFVPREDSSGASLDLGLNHEETFTWGTWINRITYTPTLEDFANYRLVYDTSFDIPLKTEAWSTRIGMSNSIDSEAELSKKKELDTTYYIRMVLKWQ